MIWWCGEMSDWVQWVIFAFFIPYSSGPARMVWNEWTVSGTLALFWPIFFWARLYDVVKWVDGLSEWQGVAQGQTEFTSCLGEVNPIRRVTRKPIIFHHSMWSRSLGARLLAGGPSGLLTSSLAPFGRSAQVVWPTHQWLDSVLAVG